MVVGRSVSKSVASLVAADLRVLIGLRRALVRGGAFVSTPATTSAARRSAPTIACPYTSSVMRARVADALSHVAPRESRSEGLGHVPVT